MKNILFLMTLLPCFVFAAESIVVLSVPTMNCPVCPITIKKSLEGVEGVSDVQVSYDEKEAVVKFDDGQTDVTALKSATANAGFPSSVKK